MTPIIVDIDGFGQYEQFLFEGNTYIQDAVAEAIQQRFGEFYKYEIMPAENFEALTETLSAEAFNEYFNCDAYPVLSALSVVVPDEDDEEGFDMRACIFAGDVNDDDAVQSYLCAVYEPRNDCDPFEYSIMRSTLPKTE